MLGSKGTKTPFLLKGQFLHLCVYLGWGGRIQTNQILHLFTSLAFGIKVYLSCQESIFFSLELLEL